MIKVLIFWKNILVKCQWNIWYISLKALRGFFDFTLIICTIFKRAQSISALRLIEKRF